MSGEAGLSSARFLSEEELRFTFEDFEIPEKFTELVGM